MGYSKAPEQPQSSARPIYMSFSRYDEDGVRTSHHMHCCTGTLRATHYATSHSLEIEVGRHHNVAPGDRLCKLCG